MDPNQLAIILGLLTNGLYSLILLAGKGVKNNVCTPEDIYELLTKSEISFVSIIEEAFHDLSPVIEPEELCEFLKSHQVAKIVEQIFSYDLSDDVNPNNLEKVNQVFCRQLTLYFYGKQEISSIAPQLFSILVKCCIKSLDIIIKDEQDLSALDYKIKFYFKTSAKRLEKNYEKLLGETKANKILITQVYDNTEKILNELTSLPTRLELKTNVSDKQLPYQINMAPDLENDFIQRHIEYKQLIEGLLNDQSDTAVAITTAIRGSGGYGKTTLAKAICHDPRTQEKFSDGILWVTLGEKPKNLIGHIQDLIYRLSDKRPEFEGLEAATSYFKDLLHEKSLLLVIDDVWDSTHLEPFMQGGTDCVRLITTRMNEVLPEGALKVRVDTMNNKEAAKLLMSGLSSTLSWAENQKINNLAKRLGYWPLLLKMVNSALKQHVERGKSLEEALNHIDHKLDRKYLTAFDPKNPQKRNQAVEATISVSFDLLDDDEFERYKELAIFPEDEEIYLRTIEKLWGKTAGYDDFEVGDLCYRFFNLSLLQTYDEDKKIIKLHDVMRDYLNNKQQQRIHLIHSKFIDAYGVEEWSDLPEEEIYIWKNLSYHLIGAGKKEELRKLLLDFNWIQSKLNFTDVHFLLNDYNFFPEDYPIEMIKGAIQLSVNALYKDKKLLDGQLLGRLGLFSEAEIKILLEDIRAQRKGMRILPLTASLTPPGGPLLSTLEGHSSKVNAVFVTPNGDKVVSASSDNTLKVWDLKTGKEIHTLTGHFGSVNDVSVTSDGNYAVSASDDRTIKTWDLKTGKEIRSLTGHSEWINSISVIPDGPYAVSGSADSTLKIWDLNTGKEIRTLTGHFGFVNSISVTSDGNHVISASSDRSLKIWDLKTGNEIRTLTGHSEWITSVSVTTDGNYAISGSYDGTLKLWDLGTGKEVRTLADDLNLINAVSITHDGNYAVSASADKTLRVWNLKTGKEVSTLTGHSDWVNAVSVTPDGDYAVSASSDNTLKVWDLKSEKDVRPLTGHLSSINAISCTLDGRHAISASCDGVLKIWDLKTGKIVNTLKGNSDRINSVSVTPDGKHASLDFYSITSSKCASISSVTVDGNYAVSISGDNMLKLWDLKTGKEEIKTLADHSHYLNAFSVTPYGNYAVSDSWGHTLKVLNLKTGKEVSTLIGHSDCVNAVSMTSDGDYAVSASRDKTLKIWNLKTGKEVHTLKGHSDSVSTVSISTDGNYAVSASADRTLRVWDLKTGEEVHTLKGHSDEVRAVAVTPDGNYAISASRDHTLRAWDLKTGKEIHILKGHSDEVRAVAVTPDGNYAISASRDHTLKVWDLKTGKEVRTLEDHSGPVSIVSISPDGNYAVSVSSGNILKIWDLKRGIIIHELKGLSKESRVFFVNRDGSFAISISYDNTLKVWHIKIGGKQISAFSGDSRLCCGGFSRDGTMIIAGEASGRVHFLLFERE